MGSEVPAGTQPFSDPDGSPAEASVLRMLLGAQLRRLREAAGISPEKAGYEIRGSRSKISRMENGRVRFKMRDIEDLLTVYGLTDEDQRSQVLPLARRSSAPDWWAKYGDILPGWFENYLGLESTAEIIRSFSAGGHAGASGAFPVLRFREPDLPDVVYIEQLTGPST